MPEETIPNRPGSFSERPRTGLSAWEATVGYIAVTHSPDALLTIRALPQGEGSVWSAVLEWGAHREEAINKASLQTALSSLWQQVDQAHIIFQTTADAVRRPTGYTDKNWLDPNTQDGLQRLAWVTRVVFEQNWSLVIVYQPTDDPSNRVQARLIAQEGAINIAGRGPSIEDAIGNLYRNATPYLTKRND
jgi:hypothetical protein